MLLLVAANTSFQHTAARRRLVFWVYNLVAWFEFQHTAARRRLVGRIFKTADSMTVSTHSRPKAAGTDCRAWRSLYVRCFNTQPPEGGWILFILNPTWLVSFNTQPPEGGWLQNKGDTMPIRGFNTQPPEGGWLPSRFAAIICLAVSTHSRPKAAGQSLFDDSARVARFNTQPPEGGWAGGSQDITSLGVSTHSRPKAAG